MESTGLSWLKKRRQLGKPTYAADTNPKHIWRKLPPYRTNARALNNASIDPPQTWYAASKLGTMGSNVEKIHDSVVHSILNITKPFLIPISHWVKIKFFSVEGQIFQKGCILIFFGENVK